MKTTLPETASEAWLEVVRQKVASLRFGSVQITVHDGRVTQVESVEKTRFVTPREEGANGQK
ncbi:YezD family protein [Luteolibacter yonseiensis]|uniref:YezD family protein n=1 Tax=Luteolibacter yonseiensis TaxID=1144680 RepID=A0A934VC18_9BACT|nr:YezD family protein [Luteolibacter yonseiensis]MBK1816024.1 YezD family protein [Luteolibacter yonseiensis]